MATKEEEGGGAIENKNVENLLFLNLFPNYSTFALAMKTRGRP